MTHTAAERLWYAFRVKPQKELWVAKVLRRSGYRCAVPVHRRFQRRAFKGAERHYRPIPIMPGYVWMCFEGGIPFGDLFTKDRLYLYNAVSFEGKPAPMHTVQVEQMLSNQKAGVYADDLLWRKMRTNFEYGRGDRVIVDVPGIEGWEGKCVDFSEDETRAFVELKMFGGPQTISMPVEAAVRAA